MNSDLVARLREHALEGIWDFTQASFDMQSAADEIESLRVENQMLKDEKAYWRLIGRETGGF